MSPKNKRYVQYHKTTELDVYAAKFDKILKYTFKYSEYLDAVHTHMDVAIFRGVGTCIL